MNTILKRNLTSVITGESIAKNIGMIQNQQFKQVNVKRKRQNQLTANSNTNSNKRQKMTHYNANMEPIKISTPVSGLSLSRTKQSYDTSGVVILPKRIREVVWNTYNGETYSSKCHVPWCSNVINVFNYHVGHDVPESKGGTYDIDNLKPICSNCNLSMGNKWTIQEWNKLVNYSNSTFVPAPISAPVSALD